MQTTTLVLGLFQLLGCVFGLYLMQAAENIGAILVWFALGTINGVSGWLNVLESCFGDKGLICTVYPIRDTKN